MAILRSTPEDFVVEEVPLYHPCGEGPFTWLWIEKRLRNTDDVAAELASELGLEPRSVRWAGRKDRRAFTRQWFSLPAVEADRIARLSLPGVAVLEENRHRHAVHPGDLLGNRFRVRLREVTSPAPEIEERASRLVDRGLPNRFGPQRYGRDGDNAARGRRVLAGERVAGDRRLEGLYLSALQSELFDEVLRRREPEYGQLLQGDVAWHHASGGLRPILIPEDHEEAADRLEISPTGPILGHKMRSPKGEALRLEKEAAEALGIPWIHDLPRLRRHHLSGGRRPLRVPVEELRLEGRESGVLEVRFQLPAGSYATVLLEELLPEEITEATDPVAL